MGSMLFGRPCPVAVGILWLALLGASTVPGYALLPPTPAPGPGEFTPTPAPNEHTPSPAPQSPPPPYSPFAQLYSPPPPPAQGGAPLLPSPPPGTPPALVTQCRGVAYDGYLSACTLWIDADSNAVLDPDEIYTNITSGSFALDITQFAAWARLVPARRGLGQASPRSTAFCFDVATLLPETLPLAAAPYPGQTCLTNITVSPLTTVAAYSGLLIADLRPALGLTGPSPPDSNAYSAAMRGEETALADLAVEIAIKNTVLGQLAQIQIDVDNDDLYQAAAVSLFASIGAKALPQLPGRRLARATPCFNLSDPDSIIDIGSVLEGMLPAGLDGSMLQVIAQATATFNALTLSQNSVENIQKASLIAQTLLVGAVDRFVSGNVTAEQFAAATSPQAAQAALASATLGGSLYGDPTPGPSTDGEDGDVNGALVGGLVGGFLGAAILLGLGAYYWLHYRKRPGKNNFPTGTTSKTACNSPPKGQAVTEQPHSIDLEAVASPTPADIS